MLDVRLTSKEDQVIYEQPCLMLVEQVKKIKSYMSNHA
jgi:hypothetical protein